MEKYDTAVIGAGMAGLVCSGFLAKAGKKVIVLEQNHQPGGNMGGFKRQGYYFDGGDQSFESLGIVFPILKELGIYDDIKWQQTRFRMVSEDFDFMVDDLKTPEEALHRAFPEETGLKELFDEIRTVSKFLSSNCSPAEFPLLNDFRVYKLFSILPYIPKLLKWTKFSYREKACSVIKNPALRNWFTSIGYFRMPYLFFAGFWHLWAHDYWYPVGGMRAMHLRMKKAVEEWGGEFRFNTLAEKIHVRKGKAASIEMSKGEPVYADKIVYTGDYKILVGGLLTEEVFKPKFVRQISTAGLTEALVNIYLGVNTPRMNLEDQMKAEHVFYFPNYDVIFPERDSPADIHAGMWVTANLMGEGGPDLSPEGKSSLVLQTYSSYPWQNFWNAGDEGKGRSEEYTALKQKVAEELIETTERFMPGLGENIEFTDVGSPLSLYRFTRNTNGASGGWCYWDKVSPVFKARGLNLFRTPLSNLFAAGHYSVWPGGVISAALSGRLVANLVLGKSVLTPLGK